MTQRRRRSNPKPVQGPRKRVFRAKVSQGMPVLRSLQSAASPEESSGAMAENAAALTANPIPEGPRNGSDGSPQGRTKISPGWKAWVGVIKQQETVTTATILMCRGLTGGIPSAVPLRLA